MRVTATYAAMLTAVTTALVALGPQVHDQVVHRVSTNLHNLGEGRIGTLLGSAFVADAGPIYVWLPGLVCVLALGELLWRSWRMLLAFTVGHVGATLLVALGLSVALRAGWVPVSITHVADVGMSYGTTAVLGALTAAIPRRWRPLWIGWWLAVAVGVLAVARGFTDAGHVVALLLGMLVSSRFGRPARWTSARLGLLVVAAAFGYLVLANTGVSLAVATGSGAFGTVLALLLARRRMLPAAALLPWA